MGRESGRGRVGDTGGGNQPSLHTQFLGAFENCDDILVAAGPGSDSPSARGDATGDGRGAIGRVGDVDGPGRIRFVHRQNLRGASDRQCV